MADAYGDQESPRDLSVLRTDSFKSATSTDAGSCHGNNSSPCVSCGGTGHMTPPSNATKLSSPESVIESMPKDRNHPVFGFSKNPLPSPPTQSFPTLRRCISDPARSPGTATQSPPGYANIVGESPLSKGSASVSALPPKAPVLRRSASDPYHPPGKTSGEGSPSAKRLKMMEDSMREISRVFHEALHVEENLVYSEEAITKDECEAEPEEDVCVDKEGDRVSICFGCPCGRGYKILLEGGDCYYKLI